MNKIFTVILLLFFKIKWRIFNKHNFTTVGNIFDLKKVQVGSFSYGRLNIHMYGASNEGISIGKFVSIASGVHFILGGNHRYDTLSTYPYKVKFMKKVSESTSKGIIVVEDDVWIGTNSIILSGLRIGKGSIIAAGTVVSKNVEPYSIYAGNPGKFLKKRFSDEIINKLRKFDFNSLNKDKILNKIDYLYTSITPENIDKILEVFSDYKGDKLND